MEGNFSKWCDFAILIPLKCFFHLSDRLIMQLLLSSYINNWGYTIRSNVEPCVVQSFKKADEDPRIHSWALDQHLLQKPFIAG